MNSSAMRNQRGESHTAFNLIALVVVLVVGFIWMPIGASFIDDTKATRALSQLGFTDVTILEKDPWFVSFKGCGRDDGALYKVQGTNPTGQTVVLEVCAGFWKGGTIRS